MRQRDFSPRSRGGHRRRPGLPVVAAVPRAGTTTQPEDCVPLRGPGGPSADPSVSERWPADPSAPAPSTADSVWEARLADLLGW